VSQALIQYGFIGLGNMGAPMAANIAREGFDLAVYDSAGTAQRAPEKTQIAESLDAIAQCETLFLSVPDGSASLAIAQDLIALSERQTKTIIDLSTTGPDAAQQVHAVLAEQGINYIDCPVSGGVAGAKAGTITVIWAGSAALLAQHTPVLQAFSGNIFHVGERAGQGQAMKLLNNFLSATALAATSEAFIYGLSQGLDLKAMIDVVNVSTGRNTASADKFPNRILSGSYDAGFYAALMRKDVDLYLTSAEQAQSPCSLGLPVAELWRHMDETLPGSDITELFKLLRQESS
jgi:3-hydroxyisobutyrate dehydrogenase-like beta-hydroxyacid dehydrogenase